MRQAEQKPSAEVSDLEQRHLRSRQAFEATATDFSQITDTEDAWQHLDNWIYEPAAGVGRDYTYNTAAKKKAANKLAAAYRELQRTFAALPEEAQRSLVERPVIKFQCRNGKRGETGPSSFEFNLPEIVVGHEAQLRLEREHDRSWRRSVRMGRVEMQADQYGLLCYQSQALFHDSVDSAAAFAIAGARCLYGIKKIQGSPQEQLALKRIEQMEKLSEVYLAALSAGDELTRSVLYDWLRLVNNRILATCETYRAATRMFGIAVDWSRQQSYPYESGLIPIGRTMVRGKNVRYIEHDRYITDY